MERPIKVEAEKSRRILVAAIVGAGFALAAASAAFAQPNSNAAAGTPKGAPMTKTAAKTGYASVNGLKMYYEIHGAGRPLVLLHGGFMTIDAMGSILPALAKTRQVIAVELEGHGRTADLDRPLNLPQMAEDVAGLLGQLKIKQADIFGFSMGGGVGLQLAVHHPDLVRKLVVVSAGYKTEGFYPSIVNSWPSMTPELFAGSPMEKVYLGTAPNPKHWPVFVGKMKNLMLTAKDVPEADIQSIKAPALLVFGDADLIRPEHAVEMFRLLGGARPDGGMGGLPNSQLAVLPGTTHFSIITRTDLLMPVVTPFLDAPMPKAR
jgi:pimeloyl-ACP methyl ester carboxylesterase